MIDLAAAAGCALLAGAGSTLVPRLIAPLPEPEPSEHPVEGDPPKQPYAEIAALPGLAWRAALAGAVAGALLGGRLGWTWDLLVLLPLVPVLGALALVDWRTHLLPTRLVRPATLVAAALAVVATLVGGETGDVGRAAVGFLVAYGTFYVLWWVYPQGLGFGDVRLAGLLGVLLGLLGWAELAVGLYTGFLLGGLGGGLLALLRVVRRRALPFGPFMVLGALVGVLVGPQVLDGLFGG